MMDVKLVLSDIDGTILPYGAQVVPARTRAAFRAAIDAGIHAGPATGRGYAWVPPFFGGDEALCATCLAANGSEVFLDGKKIREGRIDVDALRQAAEVVRGVARAGLLVFDQGTLLLVGGAVEDLAVSFPAYAQVCVLADEVPSEAPIKANAFVAAGFEGTRALADLLTSEVPTLDFDVPQPGFVNIMGKGVNKASGIDVLCEALGIGLDQVVVFGDNGNDVSMLVHVPNSVAVGNATDEAKEAARWVIGTCEEEAVAAAIEALVTGEWPFASQAL